MSATTDVLDPQTIEMLMSYRNASFAKQRAILRLLQRMAEKQMPASEACRMYFAELGVPDADARRLVASIIGDEPRGFV
jgi:hypothetical protein